MTGFTGSKNPIISLSNKSSKGSFLEVADAVTKTDLVEVSSYFFNLAKGDGPLSPYSIFTL